MDVYKANAATDILWHKVAMNIIATSKIHLVLLPITEFMLCLHFLLICHFYMNITGLYIMFMIPFESVNQGFIHSFLQGMQSLGKPRPTGYILKTFFNHLRISR